MVMDVERVQKVSKLAEELISHGMAEDMTSATKQAEQIMGKTSASIPMPEKTETASLSPNNATEGDNEMMLKMRKMTYQMNEQATEIKSLKEQLFQITKDLTELREKRHIIEKNCEKPQTKLHEEPKEPKQSQECPPAEKQEQCSHARTGGYNPKDVSVEKYFYCGGI